jgi:hypothetical protein
MSSTLDVMVAPPWLDRQIPVSKNDILRLKKGLALRQETFVL